MNLIREEKIVGKLEQLVPWPLVVKHPVGEKAIQEPASQPQSSTHVTEEHATGNISDGLTTVEQQLNETSKDEKAAGELQAPARHAASTNSSPPNAPTPTNDEMEAAEVPNTTNANGDSGRPVPQIPSAGAPLPPTARPHNVPLQAVRSPNVQDSVPDVETVDQSTVLESDNISLVTPAHSELPAPVTQNSIAASTNQEPEANHSDVKESVEKTNVKSATAANESTSDTNSLPVPSIDTVEESAHSALRTISSSENDSSQSLERGVMSAGHTSEEVSDSQAPNTTAVPLVKNIEQQSGSDATLPPTADDPPNDPVTADAVTVTPGGVEASAGVTDPTSNVNKSPPSGSGLVDVTPTETILTAEESPTASVSVAFDNVVLPDYTNPVYEVPVSANAGESDQIEITTLSPLTDSVTSSASDLFADTTQTVPSNQTETGSGDREVYADSVLPPASDSRQAFETVVPMAYLDTIRLYLSCLDFLPSPLHDFMNRNNVAPNGVVLTVLIGLLWIMLMAVQMVISRNSRHSQLEGTFPFVCFRSMSLTIYPLIAYNKAKLSKTLPSFPN